MNGHAVFFTAWRPDENFTSVDNFHHVRTPLACWTPPEVRAALWGHGSAGRVCRTPIHPARLRQGVSVDLHTLTNGTQKHRWSGYDHHASPPASAATLTKTRAGHGHIGLGASGGLDLAWASSSLDKVSGFGARRTLISRGTSSEAPCCWLMWQIFFVSGDPLMIV